jgi:hypothetical protein
MSTWTNEKHKAAREAAEGFIAHGGNRIRNLTLSDALDEIERLRALTTITDDMVERAGFALFRRTFGKTRTTENARRMWDSTEISGGVKQHYRRRARAALEAALNPPA